VSLTGGNLGLIVEPLETVVQEQANQSRNFNEFLLSLGYVPHSLVERPPELVSEFLLVGVVDPALTPSPNPEHGLEAPERHAERTDGGVLPVADARDAARLRAHVDVVLEEVGVVGHQRPTAGEEAWELRDELVQRRAEAVGQSLPKDLEVRQVLLLQLVTIWTLHLDRRIMPCRCEKPVWAKVSCAISLTSEE